MPYLTCLLLFVPLIVGEDFVVTVSKGKVRGRLVASRRGPEGFAFLGIPLAEPPLGPLRFKEAVEPKEWPDVLDAHSYRSACVQDGSHIRNKSIPIAEDCLHINVFASRTCLTKGNCSVMAFVHGGTRWNLSPERTPEENVVNNFANEARGIVYVSLPFRLGILAWLNLAPQLATTTDSNIGNRDVLTGLRWVQKEISSFGGDPSRVTLVGHSSGAQLVSELLVSPVSDGLFGQISLWSAPFYGERTPEINTKYSRLFSQKTGCSSPNDTFSDPAQVVQVEECLRGLSVDVLLKNQELMKGEAEQINGLWRDGPSGIFPDRFENLMRRRFPKMNYLIGTVSAESKGTRDLVAEDGTVNVSLVEKVCEHLAYEYNYEKKEGFRDVCADFYSTVDAAPNMNDDHMYYYPAGALADKFIQNGSCFVYSFEYPVSGEKFSWNATVVTPKHAEELKYLIWGDYDVFSERDFQMEHIYTQMISNFVNGGEPSQGGQKWMPWTRENREYFVIDFDDRLEMPGMRDGYYEEVAQFYEVAVPRAAGQSRDPVDLPPRHDCFFQRPVVDGLLSLWLNISLVRDKVPEVSHEIGAIWTLHFHHLLRVGEATIDWTTVSIVVVFLFLAFGLCFYSRSKSPDGYERLSP